MKYFANRLSLRIAASFGCCVLLARVFVASLRPALSYARYAARIVSERYRVVLALSSRGLLASSS
eukprot:4470167-Heterocapsa_arctica.AAC.1